MLAGVAVAVAVRVAGFVVPGRRGGLLARVGGGGAGAVGGVVLVRQRPGSAEGVVFITLEDETGIVNLVVWPKVFEAYRPVVMGARFMVVHGRLQRAPDSEGSVVHLVVERMEDRSADLSLLTQPDEAPKSMLSPAVGARSSSPDAREKAAAASWNDDIRSAHREGMGHARQHPRDVRILPRSRDFH